MNLDRGPFTISQPREFSLSPNRNLKRDRPRGVRHIFFCFFSFFALCLITGCSSDRHLEAQAQFQDWMQNNGKVKVLSTTAIINDLVKQVGGEHIDTAVLIQGELDPHSYQLVKGDDEKLRFAQLIFYNGLGLEHGPSLHRHLVKNPKGISLGDLVGREEPGLILSVRGQKDPHVWMDISLWAKTVPVIVRHLSEIDPSHAADFEANGLKLRREMDEAHSEAKKIMHRIPPSMRYLVTSHDAFSYFARAYLSEPPELETGEWQVRFAAPEGLAPESQLSASDIRAIIEHLKQFNIRQIFPESNVSRDSIIKIVQAGREQGVDVQIACCSLYGDAMGPPGSEGDTYLKMILYNASTLSKHMQDGHEKEN